MTRAASPFGYDFVPPFSTSPDPSPPPPSLGYLLLALFVAVWALATAAFAATVRTPPGHVPQWLYSRDQGDKHYFHNVLQAVERKFDDSIRFCRKRGASNQTSPTTRSSSRCASRATSTGTCGRTTRSASTTTSRTSSPSSTPPSPTPSRLLCCRPASAAVAIRRWASGELSEQLVALALWVGGEGSVLAYAVLRPAPPPSRRRRAMLVHLPRIARRARPTAHAFFRQGGCARTSRPSARSQVAHLILACEVTFIVRAARRRYCGSFQRTQASRATESSSTWRSSRHPPRPATSGEDPDAHLRVVRLL